MKTLLRILLAFVALIIVIGAIAYADGATFPLNHSVSVTGIIAASPARTFAIISDIGDGASWRPEVKSVNVLPAQEGKDHWIEDLGHGMKMDFIVTGNEPVSPDGHAIRKVLLQDPDYGGTWTYDLSPGPTPDQTTLKITEDGFIKSPIYRFAMMHILGPTSNLDTYLKNIQTKAAKS